MANWRVNDMRGVDEYVSIGDVAIEVVGAESAITCCI